MGGLQFKRILKKPLPVLFFRIGQEVQLWGRNIFRFWPKFSYHVEQMCSQGCNCAPSTVLISQNYVCANKLQVSILRDVASKVMRSQFTIFGYAVPDLESCNFSTDWRFNKEWPRRYYKEYQFYEKKSIAYDVKFPWELSRMFYLVPVVASQWAGKTDDEVLGKILNFLKRWREENPLAYSVNWYPMEASMRIVNLVLLSDFVRLLSGREERRNHNLLELEKLLQIMLIEHGEFVWLNREFTDVRGNHFTANIVALLLASCAVGRKRATCRSWYRYATKWLNRELPLQFCADGVNFEKSCGYHKLVLELFLLAAIVLERFGTPFPEENLLLLHKATEFSDAIMRPDGVAANFGDTDDAVALPFSFGSPRSHAPVIELARAFFNKDIGEREYSDEDRLAALFILGRTHQQSSDPSSAGRECIEFPEGGYVVVRCRKSGFFFMSDVGEVGMNGRGGHGHNDLLSFELCIGGQAIVIDPGCSGYTADLEKKEYYRRTATHSTVGLFSKEIARISGHWTICNDAHPVNVEIAQNNGNVVIRAGHDGYDRCAPGTMVWRTFEVDSGRQSIIITDRIEVPVEEGCEVCWNFPLGVDARPSISAMGQISISSKNVTVLLSADLPLELEPCLVSPGYGQEVESQKMVARGRLSAGTHKFVFRFSFFQPEFK